MVDEHDGDFELGRKSSVAPLTLRQLIKFIDTTSFDECANVPIGIRECNLEYGGDIDDLERFITVSSLFYPELEPYYDLMAHQWAEQKRRELAEETE